MIPNFDLKNHPIIQACLNGQPLNVSSVDAQTVSITLNKFNPDTGIPYPLSANFQISDLQIFSQTISTQANLLQTLVTNSLNAK